MAREAKPPATRTVEALLPPAPGCHLEGRTSRIRATSSASGGAPREKILAVAGFGLALFAAGFVQNLAMISMTASLLAAAGEGCRGRVMGVLMLAVYGFPLGLLGLSFLIERVGYALTISVATAIGLVFTLLIAIRWRASVWGARGATSAPQRVRGSTPRMATQGRNILFPRFAPAC